MAKKKLVVGAKVYVYRIPKSYFYWVKEMDSLLNKPVKIKKVFYPDQGDMVSGGWIVPRSCLKAL